MFRSAVGRRRRSLWAILAFLFAIGFAVSAFMVRPTGTRPSTAWSGRGMRRSLRRPP